MLALAGCQGHLPTQPVEGVFVKEDGSTLAITPRDDATLRYRVLDNGATGLLWPEGQGWVGGRGWAVREPVAVRIEASAAGVTVSEEGKVQQAVRVPVVERTAFIPGPGGRLYAKLVLPATPGPHPLVVTVHGSEKSSAVRFYPYDKLLVRRGLATLIFDKRGTGRSEGSYTQDFSVLADDVNAVVEWARQQPGVDAGRIALAGFSQGGWIAPLAASRNANIRAVLVGYGLLMSPIDEELAQALAPLVPPRFTTQDRAEAEALVRAALPVLESGFRSGFETYAQALDSARQRPWFAALGTGVVTEIAAYPPWLLRLFGRFFDQQTSWSHDGQAAMQALAIPTFWQVAGEDREAPPALTLQRLAALRAAGKPVTVKVYPGTDHGLTTFHEQDGKRVTLQYHPEALADMADWLATTLRARPGR